MSAADIAMINKSMSTLMLTETKHLEKQVVDTPVPKTDEVLIEVQAASLNHREIWISKGLYPGMKLPCSLGADGSGKVVAVGDKAHEHWLDKDVICYPGKGWGDNDNAPGDAFRVFGMPEPGFISKYIAVPVENLVNKPAHLSWEEAAAFPVAGLTAWRAVNRHGGVNASSKVLISGIGGGVAQAALLFCVALGAEVYVTSSSEEKIADAVASGAKFGANYKEKHWEKTLLEMSGGIDVIIEGAPAAKGSHYLNLLNQGGKLIVYGATSSFETTLNIPAFFLKHASLIGTAMGTLEEFGQMIQFIEEKQLRPKIHKVFPFSDVVEAFKELESSKQVGKLVINCFE